ncbi:aldo/keto reductase [Brevibacillus daliensis]|uniref:aldo/keto reductase n=1 Tax=Brevibacillus daliensis TaxID=2892995 RepID=UPI001E2C003A|nr:aldo/keto reductase [Brevibacillus daliensis]
MKRALTDGVKLHNGIIKPWIGLGVYKAEEGAEVEFAVKTALELGYRSIDTASVYENEAGVGKAIEQSDVLRKDIFVTTKVWNTDQGYDATMSAFETSRTKLGLEYIDLYLIHWAVPGMYKETWKALEKLCKDGYVRAIGVSNFHIHHLEDLLQDCEVKPMLNQVELQPFLTQKELLAYCNEQQIAVEAWRPLMRGNLDVPLIKELAAKYEKTPAQIVLRWDIQNGVLVLPKSVNRERIEENSQLFDFELSHEDMQKIDGLNSNKRFGPDPDTKTY